MSEYVAVADGVVCLSSLEQLATLAQNKRVDAKILLGNSPPRSDGEVSFNTLCGLAEPSLMLYSTKYVKQFAETQKKLVNQL